MTGPRTLPPGRITPSKPDYWSGTFVEGQLYSLEQSAAMARRRILAAQYHTVVLKPARTSIWGPPPEAVEMKCPVINRRRDGTAVEVITPSGLALWVEIKGAVKP